MNASFKENIRGHQKVLKIVFLSTPFRVLSVSRPVRFISTSFIREYRVADKSLARPTSRCILFYGQNISFDASLVIYINSTNIPPIMNINRIHENKNLLSL
jgi:hypothetical protein